MTKRAENIVLTSCRFGAEGVDIAESDLLCETEEEIYGLAYVFLEKQESRCGEHLCQQRKGVYGQSRDKRRKTDGQTRGSTSRE